MKGILKYGLAFLLLTGGSCKKNFVSDTILPPAGLPANNSSIRLFNLFSTDLDVTVNNIPLTSYSADQNASGVSQGLAIFPSGVWPDGGAFTIPYTLVDKKGQVHISVTPRASLSGFPVKGADTILADDQLHPTDYYILSDGRFLAEPRSPAVPTNAYDFKIRVINLGALRDTNHITGPVTVTYADGSKVDPLLTGVLTGQRSDYVELPYTTAALKVFANGNFSQQLTEIPSVPNFIGQGMIPVYDQEGRFSPHHPFKPGGVYAIVVMPGVFLYRDQFSAPEYVTLNACRIISENSPPVNFTYARVEAVNVLPDLSRGPITVKVDGQPLGAPMDYATHTDYKIFIQGDHQVQAYDKSGVLLVERTLPLFANDNMTVWVYQKNDTPDISFAATDMSTVQNTQQWRIMDLCDGVPWLSLTDDLTPLIVHDNSVYPPTTDSSAINVPLGQPVTHNPYLNFYVGPEATGSSGSPILPRQTPNFTKLRAFSSNPGPPLELPGAYLEDVQSITSSVFIANPGMYTQPVPAGEPGAYTVALIGKTSVHPPDPAAARFFILKHTK